MGKITEINWADSTFNPWIGCSKVSPGCANCYAETMMDKRMGKAKWGPGQPRVRTSAANWREPVRWNREARNAQSEYLESIALHDSGNPEPRRPRVFCSSLSDFLDDEVPIEWLADLLALIHATPNLAWLLLTKRPENFFVRILMAGMWMVGYRDGQTEEYPMAPAYSDELVTESVLAWSNGESFPSNVWIGTTVENQAMADKRIPELLRIPARGRFLSCEPLLGPVNLTQALDAIDQDDDLPEVRSRGIHWVIAGGESGPHARPMHPDWVRGLRDQCAAARVPFLFKQWGEWLPACQYADGATFKERGQWTFDTPNTSYLVGKKSAGRLLDGREHNEFPNV